jgi:hypothetical protein
MGRWLAAHCGYKFIDSGTYTSDRMWRGDAALWRELGAGNLVTVSSVSGDPDALELLRAAIQVMHFDRVVAGR